MTKVLPSKEKAHLAVAAVRVIQHRQGRPPEPAEISEMLGWGSEETHVVLRGLVDAGIVTMHKTPFEAHYEISDHLKIEELPAEADREKLRDEVDAFHERSKSKQQKMEELLKSGDLDEKKKQELDSLEKDFAEFKKKSSKPPL
ncbi:hypothetical protein ACFL6M_05745 [Candidatus Eisenbacteria bacterium]|uniref:Penicillinase repressor n=1 Tax=Eiseniibacteriota bacterium TaxID=2212470 RepID=A0ABV6YL87_UNCEI